MKKISKNIIEPHIGCGHFSRRKTVRAIILKDDLCLLVYSKVFDDYMFPGGGIKRYESKKKALKRELTEEIGAVSIKIKKPFGYIKEKRYSFGQENSRIIQTSYYYFCDILEIGEPKLEEIEKAYGVLPRWIKITDAINHLKKVKDNNMHLKRGFRTVMIRELAVLEKLMSGANEEI